MATISAITFPNSDTVARKALTQAANAMLHSMKAGKRTGDHILVTYDDGTTEQYKLGDHAVGDADGGLTVNVSPGMEP